MGSQQRRRVVVGLSGGVDSAVAAARLVEAGHDVVGVHLALRTDEQGRGCGSPRDVADAQRVADLLGIRLEAWDLAARFREQVMTYFVDEYAAGRTPNPCLRCNATIKFAALVEEARQRGFDAAATGHWGRVVDGRLYRAANRAKDQSYVLSVLSPERLAHVLLPLGDVVAKDDLRAEAAARGLDVVAAKPDSVDICFIPDGDTVGFLDRRLGQAPGEIVDADGQVLGRHDGTHHFTIGQRKGLDIRTPAADGRPRFVLGIEPDRRRVVVGPREAGAVRAITGSDVLCHDLPDALVERTCVVQIRAHGRELPAVVSLRQDAGTGGVVLDVRLAEATTGVALGQGIVAYDGDRVIAHATIAVTQG